MIDIDKVNKQLSEYGLWLVKDALIDLYWVTDKKEMSKLKITGNFLETHSIQDLILLATATMSGQKIDLDERKRNFKKGFAAFYEGC